MAKWPDLQPVVPASYMDGSSNPGSLTSYPALIYDLGKQGRLTHVLRSLNPSGDWKETPGSWIQIVSVQAFANNWEANG